VATPLSRLVRADSLSRHVGSDVYLKLESELPTGSFKVRGAMHALTKRRAAQPIAEVVAASTGNHGAAVAYAARQLNIAATIFLPTGANPVKTARIESLGAKLVAVGHTIEDARRAAEDHAGVAGAFLLDDATDADIPTGIGAIATELLAQLPDVQAVYVPVGDSALIRGVAAALKRERPNVRVTGVQTENAPAYYLSWKSRKVVTAPANTIADGLASTQPTYANVQTILGLVDDMVLVTDDALLNAVAWLLFKEHLVAEPAGAAPIAGLLATGAGPRETTVLLVSGSNVSDAVLAQAALRTERQ